MKNREATMSDELWAALTELVALKDIKDRDGKTEEYERRQPLAWEAARQALARPPAPDAGARVIAVVEAARELMTAYDGRSIARWDADSTREAEWDMAVVYGKVKLERVLDTLDGDADARGESAEELSFRCEFCGYEGHAVSYVVPPTNPWGYCRRCVEQGPPSVLFGPEPASPRPVSD